MANFEQRDQSGVLFKNNKKEAEKHPDYQGNCMVNGKEMRMSAWIKEGTKGKFMSLAFSEPYVPSADASTGSAQRQDSKSSEQKGSFDDFEDSIPW